MEDLQREDFNADVEADRRLAEDLNTEHEGDLAPFASQAEEDLEIEAVKQEEESRRKYP